MTTLGPYELNQIYTGDARELSKSIPDESVDLIFTDPVYENLEDYEWLAIEAARILKPEGHLLAWQQVSLIPATANVMSKHLIFRWIMNMTRSNVALLSVRRDMFTHWTPCFWYTKTVEARPVARFRDSIDAPFIQNPNVNHKWAKPEKPIAAWVDCFTHTGAVVFDPFSGGGTVPAVCKRLSRNYLAFEIDDENVSKARERIKRTPIAINFEPLTQTELFEAV
jgi:DNA modification methylase